MQNDTVKSSPATAKAPVVEVKRKPKGRKIFWLIFLLTLAGLVYSQYQLYILKNPNYQQKLAQEQIQATVDKVSKLMILPKELPQVLVLQDVAKIKAQQPFFKDAEDGDQVLIYSSTAIVYSPSKNKIVNVGPVTRDPQQGTSSQVQSSNASTTTKPAAKAPAKATSTSTQN